MQNQEELVALEMIPVENRIDTANGNNFIYFPDLISSLLMGVFENLPIEPKME